MIFYLKSLLTLALFRCVAPAKYYDGICWYEVDISSTGQTGWIGFELDHSDSTSQSFNPEPTPETIEPETVENAPLVPSDSPVEEYVEPSTPPKFVPEATSTPEIINSSPSQTEDNNFQSSPIIEDSNISDSDLIGRIIVLLAIIAIALAFIVFVIKTIIKIISFLLALLFKKPATTKTNLNSVKTKISPKRNYHTSQKNLSIHLQGT
jgi:hypothetical protein